MGGVGGERWKVILFDRTFISDTVMLAQWMLVMGDARIRKTINQVLARQKASLPKPGEDRTRTGRERDRKSLPGI